MKPLQCRHCGKVMRPGTHARALGVHELSCVQNPDRPPLAWPEERKTIEVKKAEQP